MRSNDKGTLRTFPVWTRVILTPLAMPRFWAGTELIMELELGDVNNALPKPKSIRLTSTEP
jgi:hypothetical protein